MGDGRVGGVIGGMSKGGRVGEVIGGMSKGGRGGRGDRWDV